MVGIILNILFQAFCFIGCVYLAGFIISLINRRFYGLFGSSRAAIYATGLIGTPVHESAHAIMCILFMHKIKEIKFFQIDEETGVLGYVNHSYNPKNKYAVLGNYFIGVAPILAGCAILSLSFYFLLPETYQAIRLVSKAQGGAIFSSIGDVFASFFSAIGRWQFWVLILLNLCIALHMNLSDADIKGSLTALPLLVILLLAINLILGLVWSKGYAVYLYFVNGVGLKLLLFLILSVGFSLLYLLLGLLVRVAVRKIAKK